MKLPSHVHGWRSNTRRFGLILAAALVAPVVAQEHAINNASERSPDYSREAFVVERSRTAWRFEADGTGRKDVSVRVRVQSEASIRSWGQLAFAYNAANERMDIAAVRVLKADGTTVTASADAVQDLTSSVEHLAPVDTDVREKHVTVPALRPGDTLEIDVPREKPLTLRTRPGVEPTITDRDDRRIYEWQTSRRTNDRDDGRTDAKGDSV